MQPLECIIAEDVRMDDEGNVLGDRVRVTIRGDRVNLYRESMQRHSKKENKDLDWDWQVDPDAGLCLSYSNARELLSALSKMLK